MRFLGGIRWFALSAVVWVASSAFANVSLKNGNFFIGYSDLTYSGGIEPKIERVFNSKSSHDGIFGFGWGSDYETFLKPSADGSVVVYENGGGAQNRFTAPNMSTAEVDKAVSTILAAKTKSGAGLSGSAAEKEKEHLRNDARYRNDEWEKLLSGKLVQARTLAKGTQLRSNRFTYQTVTFTGDGYVRKLDNGQVQTFNIEGRLTRIADRNKNWANFSYDKTGHMIKIEDNLNRRIQLSYNAGGKVEKVQGGNNKACSYQYNGLTLIKSKDSEGNVYEYRYSSDGRFNLVEIKYEDGQTMQIGYYPLNKYETVKWVKDRDGSLTEYEYGGEGPGGFNFYTKTVTKGSDGKELATNKYEYVEKAKADGERYTYKLITTLDGDKTETTYNECCGLPLEIAHNSEKTTFEYDAKGHVTKKMTPTEVTELTYDSASSKVSKVVKYPKDSKDKSRVSWAQYTYDENANLATAKNSEGKSVKIVYDHSGRIKALVDQNQRRLEFTYNDQSRPVEIRDPAVGKISVQYNSSGDIQKVDSSGGRKIAFQVTTAFQNLLDIIRPAGVTLAF